MTIRLTHTEHPDGTMTVDLEVDPGSDPVVTLDQAIEAMLRLCEVVPSDTIRGRSPGPVAVDETTIHQPGDWPEVAELIHLCPVGDGSRTRCCGRLVGELLFDRITTDESLVTCPAWSPFKTQTLPVDDIIVRIPEIAWQAHVWHTGGSHLTGSIDGADRKRLVEYILQVAADMEAEARA